MSLRVLVNASANYLGAAAVIGLPILVLPWYVDALGTANWGVVGLISSIQSVLAALDTGLSQVLIREFALRAHADRAAPGRAAGLLHSFERLYWSAGAAIGLAACGAAGVCWLALDGAPEGVPVAVATLIGAGLLSAAQLPGLLYRSAIVGAQAQVHLNVVVVLAAVVRTFGGLLAVSLIPTVATYVTWLLLCLLGETLARRALAWRVVQDRPTAAQWSAREARAVWRDMSILTAAIICGGLAAQADKLVVSALLPVRELAHYFIASQLALGLLQLVYPLTTAALPRVVELGTARRKLFAFNVRLFGVIAALVAAGAVVYVALGARLLELWLRDAQLSAAVHGVLGPMLIGVSANALCNVGYMRWLAGNRVASILSMNVAALGVMVLVAPLMVMHWDEQGAAQAWIIVGAINLIATCGWIGDARRSD